MVPTYAEPVPQGHAVAEAPRGPWADPRVLSDALVLILACLVAACGEAVEQPWAGLIVAGLIVTARCVARPKYAAYVLIFSLMVYFTVGLGSVTLPRLVALLAGIVSIPAFLRAIGRRPYDPIVPWVLALLGIAILTIPLSPDRAGSAMQVASLFQVWGIVLVLCLQLGTRDDCRAGIAVLVVGALVLAVYIFLHPDFLAVIQGQASRLVVEGSVSGERLEINEIARSLGIGIIGAVALAQMTRATLMRVVWLASAGALALGLLATQSRACYVFVPGAMLAGAALSHRGVRFTRVVSVAAVVVLVGGCIAMAAMMGLLGEGVRERFESIANPVDTSRVRWAFWTHYLGEAVDSWFIGHGLGGTRWSMPWTKAEGLPQVSHNDFIEILADLGVAGLVVFVGIHVVMIRRVLRLRASADRFFAVAAWVLLIGGGLTEVDFYRKYYLLVFALVLALVRADEAARRRERCTSAS